MLKKIFLILLIPVIFMTGCAKHEINDKDGITFKDDLGRTVTVKDPQRVATLLGSFTKMWFLAGGDPVAAPDDAWEDLKLPMRDDSTNLGGTKNISLELLLASDPDFVIASSKTKVDLDLKNTLENAKIPVAYFSVSNFNDYIRVLKICTDITGRSELYEKNGKEVLAQIENVKKQSEKRVLAHGTEKVLTLRASAGYIRAKNSVGNVLGEILKDLGCENIADSNSEILENLSMEYIIKSDPDFIFIVPTGDDVDGIKENLEKFIKENPAFNQLRAVKEGKVYTVEKELYNMKPNEKWGLAYEKMEKIFQDNLK